MSTEFEAILNSIDADVTSEVTTDEITTETVAETAPETVTETVAETAPETVTETAAEPTPEPAKKRGGKAEPTPEPAKKRGGKAKAKVVEEAAEAPAGDELEEEVQLSATTLLEMQAGRAATARYEEMQRLAAEMADQE